MQDFDARILRGAVIPTALVGLVVIVTFAVLAGVKGLVGSAFGVVVAAAFFTSTLVVLGRVAKSNPIMMMNVAMLTYLVKILVLGVLLFLLKDTTAFDTRAFAWSIVASAVVWSIAEMRIFSRMKIPYVEPHRDSGTTP